MIAAVARSKNSRPVSKEAGSNGASASVNPTVPIPRADWSCSRTQYVIRRSPSVPARRVAASPNVEMNTFVSPLLIFTYSPERRSLTQNVLPMREAYDPWNSDPLSTVTHLRRMPSVHDVPSLREERPTNRARLRRESRRAPGELAGERSPSTAEHFTVVRIGRVPLRRSRRWLHSCLRDAYGREAASPARPFPSTHRISRAATTGLHEKASPPSFEC